MANYACLSSGSKPAQRRSKCSGDPLDMLGAEASLDAELTARGPPKPAQPDGPPAEDCDSRCRRPVAHPSVPRPPSNYAANRTIAPAPMWSRSSSILAGNIPRVGSASKVVHGHAKLRSIASSPLFILMRDVTSRPSSGELPCGTENDPQAYQIW